MGHPMELPHQTLRTTATLLKVLTAWFGSLERMVLVLPSTKVRRLMASRKKRSEGRPNAPVGHVKLPISPAVSHQPSSNTPSAVLLPGRLTFFPPGDDRPCSRCIKRGCAHTCKDGVRKKAKYLEDTPAEALTQDTAARGRPTVTNPGFPQPLPEITSHRNLFGGQQASSYPMFQSGTGQLSLPQTPIDAPNQPFSMPEQSIAQQPNMPMGQQPFSMADYGSSGLQQNTPMTSGSMENLFPDSFDMGSLDHFNFDNRYGLAEFGMLNQMSTGMANSPPSDSTGTFNPSGSNYTPGAMSSVYEQSPTTEDPQYSYQSSQIGQWPNGSTSDTRPTSGRYGVTGQTQDPLDGMVKQEAPSAFAIGNSAVPSPSSMSSPQGMLAGYDDSPASKNLYTNLNPSSNQAQARPDPPRTQSHQQQELSAVSASATSTPTAKEGAQIRAQASRRNRNPSTVYEDVKQPYSYTAAFHSLTALIQRRFSPHRTAHIAKALAAIRPSFISCTMKLNKDDLVFMEKCLQRTLWEYEDFISATGTPTIICRRTGEVVAVGKEFSILTGWSSNVLLGREPNLNVNQGGGDSSNPASAPGGTGASTHGGTNTPRNPVEAKPDTPVNIVDLLDDESVCDFFTDYAHLAFGDSRGSVITPCKLLKYRTSTDTGYDDNLDDQVGSRLKRSRDANLGRKGQTVKGEAGMRQLGKADGKVDCMLCWSVKRDVFDIPMLCVMNVRHSSSLSLKGPILTGYSKVLPCI